MQAKGLFSIRRNLKLTTILLRGYLLYILIGTLVLMMPIFTKSFTVLNPLDIFFTAVSAVTTTGLSVIPTSHFNFFGQVVLLILIQLGGIGYMTMGSFLLIVRGKEFKNQNVRLLNQSFTIPESFSMKSFLKNVIIFTFAIEAIAAVFLYFAFLNSSQGENPLWSAIFHSVSAFCCAGFSLYDNNLIGYHDNVLVNVVISCTSLLGGLGFIILKDILSIFKRERVTFTSKIVLVSISSLIIVSSIIIYFKDPVSYTPMSAVFHAVSAITGSGFNTVVANTVSFGGVSFIILCLLMFIGAAPSGTGGGVKVTAVVAALAHYKSIVLDKEPTVLKRVLPTYRIRSALATIHAYIFFLVLGILVALLTASVDIRDGVYVQQYIFEAFSAIGTAGLSTGLTAELNMFGKLVMIFLMFAGRVGSRTLAFYALAIRHKDIHKYKPIEDMVT